MLGEYVNDPKPSNRVREGQVELPEAPAVSPHAISAPAAEKVH
jgi:hypothetical protein